MVFNSVAYAIFFPIVAIIYLCLGTGAGNLWLLVSSYFFYMSADIRYGAILFGASLVTYISTNILEKAANDALLRKITAAMAVSIELLLLFFFKYFGFFNEVTGNHFEVSFLLPVGISFYVFQAVGYIIDVYRGDIRAEKNFVQAMLFTAFFPGILSGPISRAGELIPQFKVRHRFDYANVREGLVRMGWGLFMKLVIASRLSIVANLVYDNHTEANPVQLILGTFAYALQIYCDFASYSELAIGSAQCMGFKLRENFFQPFFATSSAELWRRWHMSLMSWFKDYLYIPLGGSRKGRLRKYINILIVFTLSGLWHGAAWTYVLWGFLSGLFQVTGEVLKKYRERIVELWPLKGRLAGLLHHGIKVFLTVFFFNVSLVFFRAKSISQAAEILKAVFTGFSFSDIARTNVFELGLGYINLGILAFSLLILFVVDLARERGREPQKLLTGLSPALRWAAYYGMILMILLSTNIGAQRFIYFQF